MVAVEVKAETQKLLWNLQVSTEPRTRTCELQKNWAAQTGYTGNSTKRSSTEGDLNLLYADWNGNTECVQAFINRVVQENGYTKAADCPTRVDALLDVYHVRPGSSFNLRSISRGISDYCAVLLEAEWEKNCGEPQVERLVPVCSKTNVLGLRNFLWNKFATWASNVRCIEKVRNNFKEIVLESMERFVTLKILRKNWTLNTTTRT